MSEMIVGAGFELEVSIGKECARAYASMRQALQEGRVDDARVHAERIGELNGFEVRPDFPKGWTV